MKHTRTCGIFFIALSFLSTAYIASADENELGSTIDKMDKESAMRYGSTYLKQTVFRAGSHEQVKQDAELKNALETKGNPVGDPQDNQVDIKGPRGTGKDPNDGPSEAFLSDNDMSDMSDTDYEKYDINGDGAFDATDLNEYAEFSDRLIKADVNGDGVASLLDADIARSIISAREKGYIFEWDGRGYICRASNPNDPDDYYEFSIVEIKRADQNDDGDIDYFDAIYIDQTIGAAKYAQDLDNDGFIGDDEINHLAKLLREKQLGKISDIMAGSDIIIIDSLKNKPALPLVKANNNKTAAGSDTVPNDQDPQKAQPSSSAPSGDDQVWTEYFVLKNIIYTPSENKVSLLSENDTMPVEIKVNQTSISDLIDRIKLSGTADAVLDGMVDILNNIEKISRDLDKTSATIFGQAVNIILITHAIRDLIDGADMKAVAGAIDSFSATYHTLYAQYLELTRSLYDTIADILNIDPDKEDISDEYIVLADRYPLARKKIVVDKMVEAIRGKDISDRTTPENKALEVYENTIAKAQSEYKKQLESMVERFVFTVRKALLDVKPASTVEKGSQFRAVFVIGKK